MLGLEGGARERVVLGKTQTQAVCPGTVSFWALQASVCWGERLQEVQRALGWGVFHSTDGVNRGLEKKERQG